MNRVGSYLSLASAWLVLALGCSAPMAPEERLALAEQALLNGEANAANILVKQVLQQEPANVAARVLLGRISLLLDDPLGAEIHLRRALEFGADASALHLLRLEALMAQAKFSEALRQIDTGPVATDEERVPLLRIKAAAHRGLGSAHDAESVYRMALAFEPDSSEVEAELADLWLEMGRVEEAEALVAKVLMRDPEIVTALLVRGRLESLAGRYTDAQENLSEVVRLTPHDWKHRSAALALLVEVLLAQDSLDEARAAASKLRSEHRGNLLYRYFLLAEVEVRQGKLDSAKHRLLRMLRRWPEHGPSNRLLGEISLAQGQLGQARMYLQYAVNSDPGDEEAHSLLAKSHLSERDAE